MAQRHTCRQNNRTQKIKIKTGGGGEEITAIQRMRETVCCGVIFFVQINLQFCLNIREQNWPLANHRGLKVCTDKTGSDMAGQRSDKAGGNRSSV